MTTGDLLTDPTFLAFCAAWEREGCCPIAAVDYLLEQGLEDEAECLRWAGTTEATNPGCQTVVPACVRATAVYPCCCEAEGKYGWGHGRPSDGSYFLPRDRVRKVSDWVCLTFPQAVLALLHGWIEREHYTLAVGDLIEADEGGRMRKTTDPTKAAARVLAADDWEGTVTLLLPNGLKLNVKKETA
jgi:hypothetical protein